MNQAAYNQALADHGELCAKVSLLSKQNDELKEQNADLLRRNGNLVHNYNELGKRVDNLYQQLADTEAKCGRLRNRYREAVKQRDESEKLLAETTESLRRQLDDNNEADEWLGQFSTKYNFVLQALARDMKLLHEGWTLPCEDWPWEKDNNTAMEQQ